MSAQRILASGAAALLVLIVLAIAFHDDGSSGTGVTTPTIPAAGAGVLRAHVAAGQVTLDGGVQDASEQTAIDTAAKGRFGKDNVLDRLRVVASAPSAVWLATAMNALPRKDAGFGPIDVTSTKSALTVSGRVPTAAAGNALVKAVADAAGRTAISKLRVVGEGAGGTLQANIDDAVKGRSIPFLSGSAAITKGGQTVLRALVKPLEAAGSARVVVGGYTDSVGAAKANLNLSNARAHSVVVFLTKQGVPAKTLIAKGYGEAKPIASNSTAAGRSKNRRIEFTVLSG
ncbi:MAG TPA: OmpA family protein [Gaiellales bacterium]|jgi:OOP family OmpA-OmpF porin|nr:OmpA family protein [Gaiellales bacterium]